jgi:hypothetical protein
MLKTLGKHFLVEKHGGIFYRAMLKRKGKSYWRGNTTPHAVAGWTRKDSHRGL